MQIWLWAHHLLQHSYLYRIQVIQFKLWVFEHQRILLRTCDSRNLNLSPFCNLTAQSFSKWQPAVNSTYYNITTNYTSKLEGPMRLKYPGEGKSNKEGELLTILTEVVFLFQNSAFYKFCRIGEPEIQCVWKGHRCGEHFLWNLYRIWFEKLSIFLIFHSFTSATQHNSGILPRGQWIIVS